MSQALGRLKTMRTTSSVRQAVRRLTDYSAKRPMQKATRDSINKILGTPGYETCQQGGLPTEIILDILEIILAENSTPTMRTNLRLVCKRWDALFEPLGYPSLWKNISIVVPRKIEHMDGCVTYCQKCVSQSGTSYLDIRLDYSETDTGTVRDFFLSYDDRLRLNRVMGQLQPELNLPENFNPLILPLFLLRGQGGRHMQRWRTLVVNGMRNDEFYRQFVFSHLVYPAPNLVSVECQLGAGMRLREGGPGLGTRFELPSLRRLRLHSCSWNLSGWPSAVSNLRHLELVKCSNDTIGFAMHCENLETLWLEHISHTQAAAVYLRPSFRRLRILTIVGRIYGHHSIWSQTLYPSLEQIHLRSSTYGVLGIGDNLIQVFARTLRVNNPSSKFPKLREVCLDLSPPLVSSVLDMTLPPAALGTSYHEALEYLKNVG